MTTLHVIVIGGGYAGTLAANRLRVRPDIDVTLVNPRTAFVERIRLHQYAAGTRQATADYPTLLGDGVRLVVDTAETINVGERTITLASGRVLAYDYLIYAVGSSTVAPEFTYTVGDFEQAQRLRETLDGLRPDAPVTVVGGGLTGIETASELAERGRRVSLLCGGVLGSSLSRSARRSVAKALSRLGVDVADNASVTEVHADAVVLADGTVRPSATTIWTAGFAVPALAANSGLTTDAIGRLLTDETLTSIDSRWIVAAGDAAAPSNQPLRMSCQAAGPLGVQAANTVLSRIAGADPAALNQAFTGQCISLGRQAATIQLARFDDTPINAFVGGRPGAAIKEAICRGTVWAIRREATKPGSYRWLKGGNRPAPVEQEALV